MVACLSPNGPTAYRTAAPPLKLFVGAHGGVSLLERANPTSPWRVAARALEGKHISAMMADPDGAWVVAGSHDGGLYVSTDGGATWEARNTGLSIEHVFSLTSAGPAEAPTFLLGTEPVGAFRSCDLGRTWHELATLRAVPGQQKWTFPGPPHRAHAKSLAVDPRDEATIYLAVEQGGLFKTTDGGASWRELDTYYKPDDVWYRDIHRVVPVESNPDRLYMTTGVGLYASADAGESWEHLTGPDFRIGYPDHLVVAPDDARIIYMSGAGRDPTTWRRSHYADATVLRSGDGGRTWAPADHGLPASRRANIEAMSMVCHPGGFSLFVGNTDGEVFASEDGGQSWTAIARVSPISKLHHFRLVEDTAGASPA